MNAIRFWGLVAVFLAPALAQQTYFPDQGNFTFEQTSVGDWLEIKYSYTNPGGWQRDDAGAEVRQPANDSGKYWWNLGGQETQSCQEAVGVCANISCWPLKIPLLWRGGA